MSLKVDSWAYPLRFLSRSKPSVQELATFLEAYKPRFTLKAAERLADRLRSGTYHEAMDREAMAAAGIPFDQLDRLAGLLMAVHNDYGKDRSWREARRRQIDDLRGQIPSGDRERLRGIADRWDGWFLTDADRKQAELRSLKACRSWLAMTPAEREAWFDRVEAHHRQREAEREANRQRTQAAFDAEMRAKYGPDWQDRVKSWAAGRANPQRLADCQVLGLSATASHDDVRKAYRRLAMENHPDKGGDTSVFIQLKAAHDRLLSWEVS